MNNDTATRTDGGTQEIDWVARARGIAPLIEAAAPRIEAELQIPADVVAAIHDAGLYRMCLPRSMGGGEIDIPELTEVIQIVAAADASTAWCLGQGLGCSLAAAFLAPEAAQELFGRPDAAGAWGPPNPSARAVPTDGGYKVTGLWHFASGSRHATWIGGHTPVREADGTPRLDGDGKQLVRTMMFPRASAEITDVWQVVGLRGTGSDDYAVSDLFVPEAYSFVRDSADDRRESGPLYRIPLLTFYGIEFASVALGVARAALDSIEALAAEKVASRTVGVLRENAAIQQRVAWSEGQLGSSRAYLAEMVGETWDTACAGEPFPLDQRARLRIAITYAMNQAREVVNFAYQSAGTTAIFEANPFERRFRDMHTIAQQGQAHMSNLESAGKALLGLDPGEGRV